MKFWTAQYRYPGPNRLDITVKGQDPVGSYWAPTWDMVMDHKKTGDDQAYIKKYHDKIMYMINQQPSCWEDLLNKDQVVLVCFCPAGAFCHRNLLTYYLKNHGAEYMGEITDFSQYNQPKQYYYCHPESEALWISNDPNEDGTGDGLVCSITKERYEELLKANWGNVNNLQPLTGSSKTKIYAGIGARRTPPYILETMREIAILLANNNYTCNTGAARGADQEFAKGAIAGNGKVNLMLPWTTYEQKWTSMLSNMPTGNVRIHTLCAIHTKAIESVKQFHPAAENLKQSVEKLHARNYMIIEDANFVICWTPNGKEIGGTGQGIRIANHLNIPIHNLGDKDCLAKFETMINNQNLDLL